MITITTASFKGGTGKSAVSLHLASALSLFHGKRCLLIDFDSQANLTSSLGFSTDEMDTIVPVLQEERPIEEVIRKTCVEGLHLVTANTYLDGIEATSALFNDPYAHERLRYAIKGVAEQYDYCLIDIPPSLNWLCRAAFYASNYSLICAIPEPFSVLAMERLAKYHESIRRHHEIDVLGVILSLWDDRSTFNGPLLKGIEMSFPGKTLNARIRKDKMIPKAVFDGKPVFLTDRSSRASEDFQGLAQEVLRLLEGIKEESKEREVAHV